MTHYFQCDECKKPVPENDTQVIMLRAPYERQFYCGQCFASITPEKIASKSSRKKSAKL